MFIGLEGEGRGEREKHWCERNRDWTHNQVCVLNGDQTGISLVYGMVLQPTEPPRQGYWQKFLICM